MTSLSHYNTKYQITRNSRIDRSPKNRIFIPPPLPLTINQYKCLMGGPRDSDQNTEFCLFKNNFTPPPPPQRGWWKLIIVSCLYMRLQSRMCLNTSVGLPPSAPGRSFAHYDSQWQKKMRHHDLKEYDPCSRHKRGLDGG